MDQLQPVGQADAVAILATTRSAALADFRRLSANRDAIASTVMARDIPLLVWLDDELRAAWQIYVAAGGTLVELYGGAL